MNISPSPGPAAKITLSKLKKAFDNPDTRPLWDMLQDISNPVMDHLWPIIFHVIHNVDSPLATLTLKHILNARPEWIDVQNPDDSNSTPLMDAVARNRSDMVNILINAGANTTHTDSRRVSIMGYATNFHEDTAAKRDIGDLLLRSTQFSQGQKDTALYESAAKGNLGMIQSLLTHGAGFNTITTGGTALAIACANSEKSRPRAEIVRTMLKTAPGLAVIDHGWSTDSYLCRSPVHTAASWGNTDVLSVLIEAGAALDHSPTTDSFQIHFSTPLMQAVIGQHLEAVVMLLKGGANPMAIDSQGRSALHYLADSGIQDVTDDKLQDHTRAKIMEVLLLSGADLLLKDNKGLRPPDVASAAGQIVLANCMEAIISSSLLQSTPVPDRIATKGLRL